MRRITVAVSAGVDIKYAISIINELVERGCLVHVVSPVDLGGHVQWFLDPCDERARPAYRTGIVVAIGVDPSCLGGAIVYQGSAPKEICGEGGDSSNDTDTRPSDASAGSKIVDE